MVRGVLRYDAVSPGQNLSEVRCSQARRGRGLRLPAGLRLWGSPVAVRVLCPAIEHTLLEASRARRPHPASAGASSAGRLVYGTEPWEIRWRGAPGSEPGARRWSLPCLSRAYVLPLPPLRCVM